MKQNINGESLIFSSCFVHPSFETFKVKIIHKKYFSLAWNLLLPNWRLNKPRQKLSIVRNRCLNKSCIMQKNKIYHFYLHFRGQPNNMINIYNMKHVFSKLLRTYLSIEIFLIQSLYHEQILENPNTLLYLAENTNLPHL